MSLPEDFWGRIIFIIENYGESLLKGAGTTIIIALVGTLVRLCNWVYSGSYSNNPN